MPGSGKDQHRSRDFSKFSLTSVPERSMPASRSSPGHSARLASGPEILLIAGKGNRLLDFITESSDSVSLSLTSGSVSAICAICT